MNEIATRNPSEELVAQIRSDRFQEQIALALPSTVPPQRFVRAAVTALLENPGVADLDPQSVFRSLLKCAQDGLLPDGREAAITTRKGKAVYLPMIGGIRKKAAEHGWTLVTRVVYANDEFAHELGTEERIIHRPVRPGAERGPLFAAYAIATDQTGRRIIEVMPPEEIAKARKSSGTPDKGPWVEWEERMWEKTCGHRLFKKLPLGDLDPSVARIIEASKSEPADAAEAIYGPSARAALESGTPPVKPGESDGHGTEPVARQQVAGAADASHEGATAAAPATPDPDSPVGESLEGEPDTGGSAFKPPAGAVVDESIKAIADGAALAVIPNGKNKGRTIADVAADPSPESWFRYMLATPEHPVHAAVVSYSRFYFPELVEAMEQKAAAAREVAA